MLAAPTLANTGRVYVWQDGNYVIVQKYGGHAYISSPGTYNSYPDYRILSRDGTLLALLNIGETGRSFYVVDLKGKRTAISKQGKEIAWPRFSPDGRSLSVVEDLILTVYDVKAGLATRLGKEGGYIVWSNRADVLFFRTPSGVITAYNAYKRSLYRPSLRVVDRLIGPVYRRLRRYPYPTYIAEISPRGSWAFVGALKGGNSGSIGPIMGTDGRLLESIGESSPYQFGMVDQNGKLHKFVAPPAFRLQGIYPLAWTHTEKLVFAIEREGPKVLVYSPRSGRFTIRRLSPPTPGVRLIAMNE